MSDHGSTILALDVGERKIGVARANQIARIAEPVTTLTNDDKIVATLQHLIQEHDASEVVVGLPRGMDGQETEQTKSVRRFVDNCQSYLGVPVHFQDEAVTSINARAILEQTKKSYTKEDVDAMAATLILDDYLQTKD